MGVPADSLFGVDSLFHPAENKLSTPARLEVLFPHPEQDLNHTAPENSQVARTVEVLFHAEVLSAIGTGLKQDLKHTSI